MLGTGSPKSWNSDDKVWKHTYSALIGKLTCRMPLRTSKEGSLYCFCSSAFGLGRRILRCLSLGAVILENEELPKLFLDFLNVRHLPSLPKAESYGSFDETESEESSKLSHQPVLLFLRDPYVLPAASDFPNVVIEGVLHGIFYPHLQPR
ncbi:sorting nexin-24 isoform X3 [Callithrix jacchus]|uniref:sorting nexin-24 isoform X3 n=1 Tax=Callithrix jacchus TaxID=9483 RepID=UPI00159D8B0A|nr:sorting nexin-24 isoform X3 [Callithrix jacchus]XP_054107989.1 sorting nexin-24 isoform X3 [Callithrix jacchus]